MGDVSEHAEDPSFLVWFEGIVPVSLEDDALTLLAPNSFAKDYVEDRFGPHIGRVLKERLSERASLRVVVAGGQEPRSGLSGVRRG